MTGYNGCGPVVIMDSIIPLCKLRHKGPYFRMSCDNTFLKEPCMFKIIIPNDKQVCVLI